MRQLRFLYLYWNLIPSIRLCGHCQLEWLAKQGRLEYRHSRISQLEKTDLAWADAVLLGRLDSSTEYHIARQLKEAGKYLIYVIDDDLLQVPPGLSSAGYYGLPDVRRSIQRMIGMSDAILSPSPILLKKYAADGRRAITIEEPALDPVAYAPHDPSQPVRIGFAGSVDRTGDLENILEEVLMRIHKEHGNQVSFEFFGAIPRFAQHLNAYSIPYCDSYDEYRRILNDRRWDIGLAPMPDTPFHACKHYNKFVEYAAAGIVGVFSNAAPYDRLAQRGADGLFCENTVSSWLNAINQLLDYPQQREDMRKRLCAQTHAELSVPATAESLFHQLQPLITPGNECAYSFHIHGFRLLGYARKALRYLRRNGLRAPLMLVQKVLRK